MASHFSDLGFRFSEENFPEEFMKMVEKAAQASAEDVYANGKRYLKICIDDAIEFWFPAGEDDRLEFGRFEFHYNTDRWDDVIEPEWIERTPDSMQGLASFWDVEDNHPMNAYIPNAACAPDFVEGKTYQAQVACLVETLEHYKSEADYYKHAESLDHRAFIPIGQFTSEENAEQTPHALINGVVKQVEKKVNSLHGGAYYHILLESFYMNFDLLADEVLFQEVPEVGDILSTGCYLTARLQNSSQNNK